MRSETDTRNIPTEGNDPTFPDDLIQLHCLDTILWTLFLSLVSTIPSLCLVLDRTICPYTKAMEAITG
jgi:hypothetical protein